MFVTGADFCRTCNLNSHVFQKPSNYAAGRTGKDGHESRGELRLLGNIHILITILPQHLTMEENFRDRMTGATDTENEFGIPGPRVMDCTDTIPMSRDTYR